MRATGWVALGLLASAFGPCAKGYVVPLPDSAAHHRAKAPDGVALDLVHYAPAALPRRARPVLVCHGVSANNRNVDLDETHSLARWLAARGKDTWTVALRGTGDSDAATGTTIDTFAQLDLPAAIAFVSQQTGGDRIDFIGHSMGGLVVYAYLASGGQGLNAVATLGSPTRLDWSSRVTALLLRGGALFSGAPVPIVTLAQGTMPLQGELPDNPEDLLLYNPENVSRLTWKRLIANGIADIAPGVAAQFRDMVETGAFRSADKKRDYRSLLGAVRTPVWVGAGRIDRLAPAPAVRDGYRALGGPKAWRVFGRATGTVADYGHMDLVVGDRAATEVWPWVLEFLDRHANSP